MSVVDKVCAGVFAPRTKLGMQDTLALLTHCFGITLLGSPVQLHAFMADKQEEATVTDTGRVDKEIVSPYSLLFAKQKNSTAWLTLKEASGYPMLGDFLLCVKEVLEQLHPHSSFFIDHQYAVLPGQAIADGALSALVAQHQHIPLLVCEYKPKVASRVDGLDLSDLTEAMIQALYLRKTFRHPIIHCLTDMTDFHYFVLQDKEQNRLHIRMCAKVTSGV